MSSLQAATPRPCNPTLSDPLASCRMPSGDVGHRPKRLDTDPRDQAPAESRFPLMQGNMLRNVCFPMLSDAEHSVEVYNRIKLVKSKDFVKMPLEMACLAQEVRDEESQSVK